MSDKRVTIKLTSEQKKQFRDATEKDISELNIDRTAIGNLTEKELEKVAGGDGALKYLEIKMEQVIIS